MIDPGVLARQRIGPVEAKCNRCGRRSRDKTGTCVRCRQAGVLDVSHLTAEQLGGVIAKCREELERRRAELDAALEKARQS